MSARPRYVLVKRPETEEERGKMVLLMRETRGVFLYEDLRGKTVYSMPWHPYTKLRVRTSR